MAVAKRSSKGRKRGNGRGASARPEYDLIVIGTGMGGSACGAIASHGGLKVLILDKNPRPGGSCSYYTKQGFHLDIGTHMFGRGNKGPIGEVTRRTGYGRMIDFVHPEPMVHLVGFGVNLYFYRDKKTWLPFFARIARQLRIPPAEIPRIFRLMTRIATMSEAEVEQWDDRPIQDFIGQFTRDPRMHYFLGFILGIYFILPPDRASAGESIWCLKRMFGDGALGYPKGGAVTVPLTFLKIAERYGAKLTTNARVTGIEVDRAGRARGVKLDDGSVLTSRAVASTTSLRDTLSLAGRGHFPVDYVRGVDALLPSLIAVQAKIALDKPLVRGASLMGGSPIRQEWNKATSRAKFDESLNLLYSGRIPEITPIYCPVPTNHDPTLAPNGCQILTACAVAPTTDIPLEESPEKWIEWMMKALRQMIPGLDQHTIFCDTFSVSAIESWIGKTGGPAVSTGQAAGQVGRRRPSVRTPLPSLYVCGDCAGGRGVGTELAAQSGMDCAGAILEDLGRPGR